jgi:hypothetical protein
MLGFEPRNNGRYVRACWHDHSGFAPRRVGDPVRANGCSTGGCDGGDQE